MVVVWRALYLHQLPCLKGPSVRERDGCSDHDHDVADASLFSLSFLGRANNDLMGGRG